MSGGTAALRHGALLPKSFTDRVPHRERLVLSFVLEFLEVNQLPAQLLVNGGYVRDLLLEGQPDDLDVSLCLRECEADVTVATVMHGLPAFAQMRPDLAVREVLITTILSDASKDKNVDTAKIFMSVGDPPEKVEVDVMPTIGQEHYDDTNRVPVRDVRGTPEQDALRRDLTIGAMLLHVEHSVAKPESAGASAAADNLRWKLLDFYGGLEDIRAGVLRSPYPTSHSLDKVWHDVMRSREEQQLALQLGITPTVELSSEEPAAAAHADVLQKVWWVKVLRDDPLRVLRALRFSAKFGFSLHESFWWSVPFALTSLQTKVAGARKYTELVKLSKSGRDSLLSFLHLAFGRSLPSANMLPLNCLAPALFGGADAKGVAQFLSPSLVDGPSTYNHARLSQATAALPHDISDEEALGAALGAAVLACALPVPQGEVAPSGVTLSHADAHAASTTEIAREEVTRACAGLCASNEMRKAAEGPLYCLHTLLLPPPRQGQHQLFANAAAADDDSPEAVDADEFAALVHMWETLAIDKEYMGKREPGHLPSFIIALAHTHCDPRTASAFSRRLATLRAPGPSISGNALDAIPQLPMHLRRAMLSNLHVLCRLRGDTAPLQDPPQLAAYFSQRHPGLLDQLEDEWYLPADSTGKRLLRQPYAPARQQPRTGKKAAGK